MSKTADLRRLIVQQLNSVQNSGLTYYRAAPCSATFPYKTFEFESVALQYTTRDDYALNVDVWCKGANTATADAIGDSIETAFSEENVGRAINLPQTNIFPTFFLEGREIETDPNDRNIIRVSLRFSVQSYQRSD